MSAHRALASVERDGSSIVLADTFGGPTVPGRASTTSQALERLYAGPRQAFGWDIDPFVNCALSEVEPSIRVQVCTTQPALHDGWRLTYVPGRSFTIRPEKPSQKHAVTLYDLSSFWPGRGRELVAVAREWGIAVSDLVADGEEARRWEFGGWSLADLQTYAIERAAIISDLADRVMPALKAHDLDPRSPTGIGAVGARVLRNAGIRKMIASYRPDHQPIIDGQPMLDLMMRAYYGGRVETMLAGHYPAPLWRLDLRSAYLWALAWVGPLGYEWDHVTTFSAAIRDRMALYRVSWSVPGAHAGPFPHRAHSMATQRYVQEGSGWYWWPEVRSALSVWGEGAITVHEGYISPRSSARPLEEEARRLYQLRQSLEASHDPLTALVKGAGNSAYGKLAQRLSFDGRVGYWYNPGLSGWVCSAVRARVIDVLGVQTEDTKSVLAIMVDGILSAVEPEPSLLTARLGGWRAERYERADLIGTGLYRLERADGGYDEATTRVSERLDWEWLLDELIRLDQARVDGRWFVPQILADLSPDQYGPHRCRWVTTRGKIDPFTIAGKRDNAARVLGLDWRQDFVLLGAYQSQGQPGLSAPYSLPPAWSAVPYDPIREALAQLESTVA